MQCEFLHHIIQLYRQHPQPSVFTSPLDGAVFLIARFDLQLPERRSVRNGMRMGRHGKFVFIAATPERLGEDGWVEMD